LCQRWWWWWIAKVPIKFRRENFKNNISNCNLYQQPVRFSPLYITAFECGINSQFYGMFTLRVSGRLVWMTSVTTWT
jgi:hypothetical protein